MAKTKPTTPTTPPDRPLRADARRNRERVLAAAGALFARHGNAVQMEEIAATAGLGMGTVYRHFPTKQALLTAMVRERFRGMAELATTAEQVADPGAAFEQVLRGYLEAAEGDAGFQLALLGGGEVEWAGLEDEKEAFGAALGRIVARAVHAGRVRADFTVADFPMIVRGVMATMYFSPAGQVDWRRHLDLALDGIRVPRR